jgi:hypothetical protein
LARVTRAIGGWTSSVSVGTLVGETISIGFGRMGGVQLHVAASLAGRIAASRFATADVQCRVADIGVVARVSSGKQGGIVDRVRATAEDDAGER